MPLYRYFKAYASLWAIMTNTTLITYSIRDFANKEQLELYLIRQKEAFTPEVIELFTKAGMLRRVKKNLE